MRQPLESDKQSSLWPLALFAVVVSALSLFASKRNQSGESVNPEVSTDPKANRAPRKPPILPETPTASPDPSNTKGGKHDTPLWEKVAVAIAFALLVVNICQMRATQDAVDKANEGNRINRDSLYSVQRAFITSTKPTTELARYDVINGVPQNKPLKMIEFTSHWENVGNTPAIGVVTAVGKIEQPDEITEQEFMTTQVDRTAAKSAIGPKAIIDSATLRDDETFLTDNPCSAIHVGMDRIQRHIS